MASQTAAFTALSATFVRGLRHVCSHTLAQSLGTAQKLTLILTHGVTQCPFRLCSSSFSTFVFVVTLAYAWRCYEMEVPLPMSDDMLDMYRSPKPELLQLLFEHMPAPAQDATKHANSDGYGSKGTSTLRNGNGHHADGSSTGMNGNSQTSNGYSKPANGHSHAAKANGHSHAAEASGHSSNGNGNDNHSSQNGNSSEKPVIHVDSDANGISQVEVHQQARDLQGVLQDEVEAYLDKRHIIDILHDFSGSHPPLATLLSCLRPLQPRLYSISSSQLEHPTYVQITVAVVKYVALGRNRIGVTSTFLKERMQVCCIACGPGPLLVLVPMPVAVCKLVAQLAAAVHSIPAFPGY